MGAEQKVKQHWCLPQEAGYRCCLSSALSLNLASAEEGTCCGLLRLVEVFKCMPLERASVFLAIHGKSRQVRNSVANSGCWLQQHHSGSGSLSS